MCGEALYVSPHRKGLENTAMYKKNFLNVVFDIFNHIFMILMMFVCLYPFLYVAFASLSNSNLLMEYEGLLWHPLDLTFDAYKAVAKNPLILSGYANTLFVLFFGVVTNIIMTTLAAYVLSRKEFAIRKYATIFVMITMFFSGGLVPTYLTVTQLGLENSLWALIIPAAISVYNMIILRTGFLSVPESVIESAKLDGASHTRILYRIVVPLAMPTIAVIILYYAVWHWNSWFNAMLYLRDRAKFPLQLVLREILIQNDTDSMLVDISRADSFSIGETVQYAIIIVATLPILVVYPFVQKYFVKGAMVGAVKG